MASPAAAAQDAAEALVAGEDVGGIRFGALPKAAARAVAHSPQLRAEASALAVEMLRILVGSSEVEPEPSDWRFKDKTWAQHPLYRRTAQSYLAWTRALKKVVEGADLDWRGREQARLAVEILTATLAPTNTLVGNPEALKTAFQTAGFSLLRGTRNVVHDLRHNGGMPSQVDTRPFEVGRNLACTPGAVVYRDEVFELLQYTPTTETVYERPTLMVVPQINKYYFMDLAPRRSFVEHAVARGNQFFTMSWRNPGPEQAEWDMDRYATAVLDATDVVRDITGSDDLNTLALCAGGIMTSMLLSHLAAVGDDRINAAAFGVMLLDFDSPALIGAFGSEKTIATSRWNSKRKGMLDGPTLAKVFAWTRPNDLVFNYVHNNYLLGNDPPAFDVLAWNADSTNLPAALHGQFLDIFGRNTLCTPGGMTLLGTPVDLANVKIDTYVTGATTDHLTPWTGCYRATQLFGGDSTFILSNAGHIQSLVNPPGNPKAKFWAGPEPGPDPKAWLAKAEEHQGTWWDHWADWNTARAGNPRPAPKKLGSRRYPILDEAPGQYVKAPRP